jgi:hypothetical protein
MPIDLSVLLPVDRVLNFHARGNSWQERVLLFQIDSATWIAATPYYEIVAEVLTDNIYILHGGLWYGDPVCNGAPRGAHFDSTELGLRMVALLVEGQRRGSSLLVDMTIQAHDDALLRMQYELGVSRAGEAADWLNYPPRTNALRSQKSRTKHRRRLE